MKDFYKYNPSDIESKWQKMWGKNRVYQPDLQNAKKPYYNLMMFPYPSAEGLHVGNMYAFTGADINGRYKRMRGFDVFEPIGLDGFGIHSENYAIKIGKHPAEQAKISQKNFYKQLHAIGNGFAWENTLETYDPDYYRWTQWIFVQMFKHGLAYRKKSPVNFCPSCKTVLSDEQVIDGFCERCKTAVEKKEMEQWYFKITKYAERLLKNLDTLDWTNKVKVGQKNWIGKKEGININYPIIQLSNQQISNKIGTITCFTTRPDTNFGATFIVLAPEHPFVATLLSPQNPHNPHIHLKEIAAYVAKSSKKSDADRIAEGRKKTGVFTGFYAVNQLNDYKMPIWISDFALMSVGTGAVVGVPGHDMRDFEFAKEFNIPIIRVVVGKDGDKSEITKPEQVQEKEGTMSNSGFLDGMEIRKAIGVMMDHLEEKGWGKRVTTYKLRDWCISRQRYWGAPIPMIFCEKCQWQPVPEDQLPVLLPENVKDWKPEGTGKGPLAKIESFVNVVCPECGNPARRETDVCDTFLDSSWYHMRYPSIGIEVSNRKLEVRKRSKRLEVSYKNPNSNIQSQYQTSNIFSLTSTLSLPWDPAITQKWLPVTQYIGGAEHTVLHLLYARFVAMVFHDLGMINFEEPYSKFYAHGLIIAEGAKMSKSKGNVVVPDAYIAKYGADTLRTYLMFLGPFDSGGDFRDTGIAGMFRFLFRVWRFVTGSLKDTSDGGKEALKTPRGWQAEAAAKAMTPPMVKGSELTRIMHRTIKEVTIDMENFRYNTAIAHIMSYVNELTINNQQLTIDKVKALLLLLAPFAPHMTEELWRRITDSGKDTSEVTRRGSSDGGGISKDSIHLTPWPTFDPKYLVEDVVTIVVQVNGKTRVTIKVQSAKSKIQNEVELEAKKLVKVQKYLSGKTIKKVIFIPGKLINFVI